MAQRCAVPTRPGYLRVVRAPECCNTAGASLLSAPHSLAERAMGAKKRRHKGSARALSGERFSLAKPVKPGGRPEAFRLEAELSERPLRGRLPVLHCCPSARFPTA
jgi:hypothetical protein